MSHVAPLPRLRRRHDQGEPVANADDRRGPRVALRVCELEDDLHAAEGGGGEDRGRAGGAGHDVDYLPAAADEDDTERRETARTPG